MKLLDGIRVVEFATHVVVPAAARVLGDWGADVIKIEAPKGDVWRNHGQTYELPIQDECNPMYSVCNSGKRFVSLNLKTPEGKEAMLRILEGADVFMTNVRWGAIERLGLDYDTLHQKFPKLIYMHFNGFGYEGAYKDRPGFDINAFWAMSGATHEFHEPNKRPGPAAPPAFGDTATSNAVLSGVLGGLIWRMKTGEGIRMTSSLLANGLWCNYSRIVGEQEREDGKMPPQFPKSAESTTNPFSHVYECSDGEWMSIVGTTHFKTDPAGVLKVFGLEKYADDDRYNRLPLRQENARELYGMCVNSFKQKTASEWDSVLGEADIPHQKLEHSREVSKLEQAWANDYFARMTCPDGRSFVVPNSPVRFFGFEHAQTRHAGAVGANTTEILMEYGYTAEDIARLKDSKAAYGN